MKSHFLRFVFAAIWCWSTLIPFRVDAVPDWVLASASITGEESDSPGISDLLAWYNLENASDSSSNARNMSTASGTPTYVTGLVNNAVDLDGSEWISRSDEAWMQPAGSFTICAWIKPDDGRPVQTQGIFGQYETTGSTNQRAYTLALLTDGKIRFVISSDGTSATNPIDSSTTLADGPASSFTFICGVFTSSTSVKIYVDGVERGTNSTSIPAQVHNSTGALTIGNLGTVAFSYTGLVDSAAFFNRALTQDEITWLYFGGAGRQFSDL